MKRYDFDMEFFGHHFHTGCFDNVNDFDGILLQTICRAFSHFKDATGILSEFVEADCTRMARTNSEERFVFYTKAARNWGHQLTVSYIMRGTDSFLPRRKYAHDFEGHFVDQQYLPDELTASRFWKPQPNRHEDGLAQHLRQLWKGRYD